MKVHRRRACRAAHRCLRPRQRGTATSGAMGPAAVPPRSAPWAHSVRARAQAGSGLRPARRLGRGLKLRDFEAEEDPLELIVVCQILPRRAVSHRLRRARPAPPDDGTAGMVRIRADGRQQATLLCSARGQFLRPEALATPHRAVPRATKMPPWTGGESSSLMRRQRRTIVTAHRGMRARFLDPTQSLPAQVLAHAVWHT